MRPATAVAADGPQNLLDAVTVALDTAASGVMVVCAGVVHDALRVQKVHPYRLDAFDSGVDGPLGFVEHGQVRWSRVASPVAEPATGTLSLQAVQQADLQPWVEIVLSHQGADGRMVDALVREGVQGLVVAGTGNGTVHQSLHAALLRAQSAGVRVVRATRCAYGQVLPNAEDGLPDSHGLSPVKARVAMMLSLLK